MQNGNSNGSNGNGNSIGTKVIPKNELASSQPQMSLSDFTLMLSELHDEAFAHGLEDVAMLLHRALGKMQVYACNAHKLKMMEKKLGNDAT